MLNDIKLLLGLTDSSKDAILTLLIKQATQEAKNITHNDVVDDLENAIIDMVIYNYNRLGTEGLDSESYSGVSFNYTADYPEFILRQLRPKRLGRTI